MNIKLVAVIALYLHHSCLAQTPPKSEDFGLALILSQTQAVPLEPIQAVVTLQNKTTTIKEFKTTSIFAVYYRREGAKEWEQFAPSGPTPTPPPTKIVKLPPGGTLSSWFFLDVTSSNEGVFSQPGVYWVKGAFYDLAIESQPQKVEVIAPVGRDAEAFEALRIIKLDKYLTLRLSSPSKNSHS